MDYVEYNKYNEVCLKYRGLQTNKENETMNTFTATFDTAKETARAFKHIVEKEQLIIATRGRAAWSSSLTLRRDGLSVTVSSGYFQETTLRNMFPSL